MNTFKQEESLTASDALSFNFPRISNYSPAHIELPRFQLAHCSRSYNSQSKITRTHVGVFITKNTISTNSIQFSKNINTFLQKQSDLSENSYASIKLIQ